MSKDIPGPLVESIETKNKPPQAYIYILYFKKTTVPNIISGDLKSYEFLGVDNYDAAVGNQLILGNSDTAERLRTARVQSITKAPFSLLPTQDEITEFYPNREEMRYTLSERYRSRLAGRDVKDSDPFTRVVWQYTDEVIPKEENKESEPGQEKELRPAKWNEVRAQGDIARKIREDAFLPRREIAEMAGLPPSTVTALEKSKEVNVRIDQFLRLAQALSYLSTLDTLATILAEDNDIEKIHNYLKRLIEDWNRLDQKRQALAGTSSSRHFTN